MSKKKNDQNFISELLGKLKESYSEPEKTPEPQKTEAEDSAFQKQLAQMLNKASTPAPQKKKKTSAKTPRKEEPEKRPEKASAPVTSANTKKKKATVKKSPKKKEIPPEEAVEAAVEPIEEAVEVAEEAAVATEPEVVSADPTPLPSEPQKPALKQSKTPPSDTIVIRPKQSRPASREAIVIRPRVQSKPAPTPQKITEPLQKEPIRIGKESSLSVKSPTPAKVSSAADKKTSQKAAPATASAGAEKTVQTPTQKAPGTKKKPSSKPSVAPTVSAPERSPFDEALESVFSEALEPQPIINESEEKGQPEEGKELHLPKNRPSLSFSEQIHQKTGLTDEDVALLFELGYENELSNLVGSENLKKLKSTHLRKQRQQEETSYPTSFGYRGKEYTGEERRESVLAAYVHDRKHLILRLVLTALSALCLLFIEIPSLHGTYLTQMSQKLPPALPIIGFLLCLLCIVLSAKQLFSGIVMLIQFTPTPYSACGILILPTLVYDIIALFKTSLDLPVNFLLVFALLIMVLCDNLRLSCEMRVFRVISEDQVKHVLETVTLRKKKLKQGDKIVKILNDDVGENFYRIAKADGTTGFFRRFNTMYTASHPFSALIWSSLGISVLSAFAVALKTQDISKTVTSFMTFLLIGAPLSAVYGYFYPLFHANRILTQHQSALVGEESVEEYAAHKTVVFEDKDMFHTEKCTEIALNESGDFQNDMKLASALFRKIGSTLDPIGKATAKQVEEIPIALVRIGENGTEATANDHHLLAGDAEFFKKSGIRIPKESSDRALRRTENVKVMYVAIDGVLKLSYEIEYTAKASFEKMAEALSDGNTSVAIRSYDPNLNTAFVEELRHGKGSPVRVIKPGRYEEDSVLDLVDTGAVSLDSPEKTVSALHAAAKIRKTRFFTLRMQLIATLLGCGGSLLLILFGNASLVGILQIAVYHLFWLIVSMIAAHAEITEEKLHLLGRK